MSFLRENLGVLAGTASVVLAAVLVLGMPGVQRGDPPAAPIEDGVRIMAVGDSITQGGRGDLTWRWYLDRHLSEQGVAFDMVGPRDTLGSPQSRGISAEKYADPGFDRDHAAWWGDSFLLRRTGQPRSLVGEFDPDVVVLALGTNDVALWHATGAETVERAREWIDQGRSVASALDVVVVGLPGRGPEIDAFNAGIQGLAGTTEQGARTVVAPWPASYRGEAWAGGDTRDGVHPNSSGQAKIAHAVAQGLAELGIGVTPRSPFEVVPDRADGREIPPPAPQTPAPQTPAPQGPAPPAVTQP